MAYDVPQHLKMSQAELDTLFTGSAAGEIPNGEAQGTAIISETSLVAGWIRDEIRQIGPGLYLGKVYGGKKRLIDFALKF
jgi:hypothetical protein